MLLCVYVTLTYLLPQNMRSLLLKINYDNLKAYNWVSSRMVDLRASENLIALAWSSHRYSSLQCAGKQGNSS